MSTVWFNILKSFAVHLDVHLCGIFTAEAGIKARPKGLAGVPEELQARR
jgi:hypothetical protein